MRGGRAFVRLGLGGYALGVVGLHAALAWRLRTPRVAAPSASQPGALPFVSIVVPARDEERNIRGCVESLLAQDYPAFEVIVVDDGSTDDTPRLLAALAREDTRGRLRTLRVAELPEGWAGKPHALHVGASAARGAWLLFTDADTRHRPGALRAAVLQARAQGADLFSFSTAQDLPDFWGRVLMPLAFMGISMQYPARAVNDPASPLALANGQYLLLRRAAYERVGGYAAPGLRATLLDDRDMAQAVKRAGGRLLLADGRDVVRTRMYTSLREHWRGWGKNAYAGSRGGVGGYALMLLGLPLVSMGPFALAGWGALCRRRAPLLAGTAGVAAILGYRALVDRQLGVPLRYGWTHPLGGAVFTGILANSLWHGVRGRSVPWRGRSYPRTRQPGA